MWRKFQKANVAPFPPIPEEETNPTIFSWSRNHRTWIHLAAFLLFSVLIHGSGFYLFQVVYPSPIRERPRADSISILDANDPAVRSMLRRIDDRMMYLIPPSDESGVRISLESLPVRFTPSFESKSMELEPPAFSWTLPPVPGVFSSDLTNTQALEDLPSAFSIALQGELLNREIAPWSILQDYLRLVEDVPEIRLQIGVSEEGMVSVDQVEGQIDADERAGIKTVVESTLRFLPSQNTSSGWISIRKKN